MQIANLLSDLTSLRVCDHTAALALVNARTPSSPSTSSSTETSSQSQPQPQAPPKLVSEESAAEDLDMQRATDLVELHYGVKVKHAQGLDQGLIRARRDVDRVLEQLGEREKGGG